MSGLSHVHPHLLRACRDAGIGDMKINLLFPYPCPPQFTENKPLRLSLQGLRKKFETLLAAEGLSASDLSLATLCFTPGRCKDDYCAVCRATLQSHEQEPVEYIVNYLGQTLSAHSMHPPDVAR